MSDPPLGNAIWSPVFQIADTRSDLLTLVHASLCGEDLRGLRALLDDYPEARAVLFYGGSRRYREGAIDVVPIEAGLRSLETFLE